jgi:hypothetical protein
MDDITRIGLPAAIICVLVIIWYLALTFIMNTVVPMFTSLTPMILLGAILAFFILGVLAFVTYFLLVVIVIKRLL